MDEHCTAGGGANGDAILAACLADAGPSAGEAVLRTVFDGAALGISLVDRHARPRYTNPALHRILGRSHADLCRLSWRDYTHPDDVATSGQLFAELLSGLRDYYQVEKRYLRPDGSVVWARLTVSLVAVGSERASFVVSMVEDVTAARGAQAELVRITSHDPLTGMPNRRAFLQRLACALTERGGGGVAVLLADIDRFTLVNESLGHDAGDELVAAVAERLGEALRPGDLLARLGADEFAILCPRVGTAEAARGIAERLTAALAPPFTLDGAEVFVTAGVGVALSRGRRVGAERLLRDAGAALHRAKELGGGRVATYDQQLHTRAVGRLRTDSELRRALQRGELRLDYQPIVSLDCGRLDGVEALLRWQHPERGLVAPLDFLPVAEETGLIVPIGSWVVRETLAQLRRWDERFPDQRPVAAAINLSGRQVLEPGLAAMVATALDESGVDPGRIVMEITESVVMEDVATSARVLGELKGLGLRLAIDDFGTGFSSLSYLKRFPVDLLKVDRSFVRGVGADAGDAAIVDAVITLARALCLSTVAEGVETLAQRDRLQDLGCGYAQGWLYGRPVAPDLLLPLLAGDRVAPAAGDATGAPSP